MMKHKLTSDEKFNIEIKKLEKDTDFLIKHKFIVFAVITIFTIIAWWLVYSN